jgi:hypothetical protein
VLEVRGCVLGSARREGRKVKVGGKDEDAREGV